MLLGNAAGQHPDSRALLERSRAGSPSRPARPSASSARRRTRSARSWSAPLPEARRLDAGADARRRRAAQGLPAAQRRARARRRRPARARSPRSARAEMVVALTPFMDAGDDVADVLLPIAPFTETSGTFVNAEGRVQGVHGVVKPLRRRAAGVEGAARARQPARPRRLRRSRRSEEVRDEALGDVATIAARLAAPARRRGRPTRRQDAGDGRRRSSASPTCRSTPPITHRAPRAGAAAHRRCAAAGRVGMPRELVAERGIVDGDAGARQPGQRRGRPAGARSTRRSRRNVVRVAAGHPLTAALGAMFGTLAIDVVAAGDRRCRDRASREATPSRCSTRSTATAARLLGGSWPVDLER